MPMQFAIKRNGGNPNARRAIRIRATTLKASSLQGEGTQSPPATLDRGWRSCRALAVLFAGPRGLPIFRDALSNNHAPDDPRIL